MLIEIKHLLRWTVNKSMQVKHRMSTKNNFGYHPYSDDKEFF